MCVCVIGNCTYQVVFLLLYFISLPPRQSQVPSRFTVTAVAPGPLCDPVFASEEYEGAIEPGGSHRLKLLLSPSLATPHPLVGHFRVCAVGGVGSSMITCTGLVEGGWKV